MRRLRYCALPVVTILAACAAQLPRSVPIDSGTYRGNLVSLRTGDTLVVRLRSNPSTGFSWARAGDNPPGLRLIDSTYTPPAGTAVGEPGWQHFRFHADRPGRATLRLVYARPWESGAPPADSIRIDLSVAAR